MAEAAKAEAAKAQPEGRARRVPDLKPGKYSDGLPLDEVQYLECKLILKPNHFTSRQEPVRLRQDHAAAGQGERSRFRHRRASPTQPLQIREVLFLDTADFRLYNNAFILRRRIPYKDGFPIGDPEIVFKFRHPDMQKTAEMDVRPKITGRLPDQVQGRGAAAQGRARRDSHALFSHNVEFGLSALQRGGSHLAWIRSCAFSRRWSLKGSSGEKVELVSDTIVEEVLQDIGMLDFGKGMTAVANVALWRSRGDHRPLIGEFAFQIKFKRREDLNEQALKRAEAFFLALQDAAKDWIAARGHQDRRRLPPEGQSAPRARVRPLGRSRRPDPRAVAAEPS